MSKEGLTPQQKFIVDLYPAALRISRETGCSWELILAQAAQETGWGQKVLPGTNNIFNIKASPDWHGERRVFNVPEVENGRIVSRNEPFRVYPSIEESLRDRVAFLRANPRYERAGLFADGVRGNLVKEAQALQRGHYATDPEYADNLVRVFHGRTMQSALAYARAHANPSLSAPSASPTDQAPTHGRARDNALSANAAIFNEAYAHFIGVGNQYEYGRSDMRSQNREGNGHTDPSRYEQDLDGDHLKGVDCSSFVWRGLKDAGFDVPPNTARHPFTTSTLFSGHAISAFARRNFQVIPGDQARGLHGPLEVGDIICFKDRKGTGQHVAIFGGYDAHGVPRFIGSQTGHGPGWGSAEPGTYWNGGRFEIVAALRAKPEFHVRAPLHGSTAVPAPSAARAATSPHGTSPNHATASAAVLRSGDTGPNVSRLQQRLFDLGYHTQGGKPLSITGTFDGDTAYALKEFQREHGLEGKGIAGPKTEAALRKAEAALMSDPSHPQHALFTQAVAKVAEAERAKGIPVGPHTQRIAGALAVEAVREGLTRIDRVAISDSGKLAWAIEDRPGGQVSGLGRTDGINLAQASAQPLAESSRQAHEVAVNVQTQQAEAQAQTQGRTPQQVMAR